MAATQVNAGSGQRGSDTDRARGFADVHAPSAAIASLVASDEVSTQLGLLAMLAAFTANTLTKAVLAWQGGTTAFRSEFSLVSGCTRSGVGWLRHAAAHRVTGSCTKLRFPVVRSGRVYRGAGEAFRSGLTRRGGADDSDRKTGQEAGALSYSRPTPTRSWNPPSGRRHRQPRR
jgi:hypothetical protein